MTDTICHRCRRAVIRFALAVAALLAVSARPVLSQVATGVVQDSASGGVVSGAVVLLLDAAGQERGRGLSDARGIYAVRATGGSTQLRVMRIGFRPQTHPLGPVIDGIIRLDLRLARLQAFLDPVLVVAAQCRRSGRTSPLTLIEQARAGLLTSIVSRDENPASITRITYERSMRDESDRVERQVVRSDSSPQAGTSFSAVNDAAAFVRRGFFEDGDGTQTFFAPDAETLIDAAFAAGYCFRVMPRDRDRPHQVGLGFAPADRRRGRVDINGALWIDTLARELRDIEFRYIGLGAQFDRMQPGGRVVFRQMANGMVLVERWNLDLVGLRPDTVQGARGGSTRLVYRVFRHESGGQLVRAEWSDGTRWAAALGAIRGRARWLDGQAAPGLTMVLRNSPYQARTDSAGEFTVPDVVPGTYSFIAVDDRLLRVGLSLAVDAEVRVGRDTAEVIVVVPTLKEYISARCREEGDFVPSPDGSVLLGRALYDDGTPIADARWSVSVLAGDDWVEIANRGRTGDRGLMPWCQGLTRGTEVELMVVAPGGLRNFVRGTVGEEPSILPVMFPRRPAAPAPRVPNN